MRVVLLFCQKGSEGDFIMVTEREMEVIVRHLEGKGYHVRAGSPVPWQLGWITDQEDDEEELNGGTRIHR